MKKIILLSLLIISISTEAQVQFYIEPSANISLISNSQATRTNEVATDRPGNRMVRKENYSAIYTNKVGGGITAGLNYFFKEDFSLDAGLDFNNVNFHQKARTSISHVYMPLNGNAESTETSPVMTVKSDDSHSLFLLALPVSLSYYLLENDLSVGVGLIPTFLLHGTGGRGSATEFNKAHLGVHVQLKYQFVPQWCVVAGFQEYSSKLYKPELKQSFSNLRFLKLGVKYNI